jgi:replicative DNA helicase
MTTSPLPTPHDVDTERALLGAILANPYALEEVGTITAADFFLDRHKWIWDAILEHGEAADTITVANSLERGGHLDEAGGTAYLARLIYETPTSQNADVYAALVRREAVRRRLLAAATDLATEALAADDPEAAAAKHARALEALSVGDMRGQVVGLGVAAREWYDRMEERILRGVLPGVTTGYPVLDRKTNGLRRGELMILAARPSVGKTSLAAQMSVRQARAGLRVGVLSLEEKRATWNEAAAAAELGLDTMHATADDLARMWSKCEEYNALPLEIYDEGYTSLAALERVVRGMARSLGGLDVLYLDHLAYVDHGAGSPKDRHLPYLIGLSTKRLAKIAKAYGCAVVCLCQLNRDSARGGDEPALTDLRDSGEIEQDARTVWFIHRPGYYADPEPPADKPQPARILVRKNSSGPTGRIDLAFVKCYRRFAEYAIGEAQ